MFVQLKFTWVGQTEITWEYPKVHLSWTNRNYMGISTLCYICVSCLWVVWNLDTYFLPRWPMCMFWKFCVLPLCLPALLIHTPVRIYRTSNFRYFLGSAPVCVWDACGLLNPDTIIYVQHLPSFVHGFVLVNVGVWDYLNFYVCLLYPCRRC